MEKKTCVFLACNENYAFALANVIIGLRRYNEDLITNIVVYHDITEETRGKISRLWEFRHELRILFPQNVPQLV